ncbi:hypothetical protein RND71_028893 [Anisodus tanguticus]|uniref:Uncharacterized protein n=1 Tax=Anisodus tanguticus TaxID=243964 RepID=A0AAE1RJA4_9SOLA|nr:hypothetical protein RND71_028893 [Anisodus tanguticus]
MDLIQRQKERHKLLTEKLKQKLEGKLKGVPLLNKGAYSTRDGSSKMGSKDSLKVPSTNVAILPPTSCIFKCRDITHYKFST